MSKFLFSGLYNPQTWNYEEKGSSTNGFEMSTIGSAPKSMKESRHIPGRTVPKILSRSTAAEERHRMVLKELGWELTCYPTKNADISSAESGKSKNSEQEKSGKQAIQAGSMPGALPADSLCTGINQAGDTLGIKRLTDAEPQSKTVESLKSTSDEVMPLLLVKNVDMNAEENSKIHHTTDYVIASPRVIRENVTPGTLIVRRGTEFTVKVLFNRPYNKEKDRLHFVFELAGDVAKVSKANLFSLDVKEGLKFASWSVCVDNEIKETSTEELAEQEIIMVMMQPTDMPPVDQPTPEGETEEKLAEEIQEKGEETKEEENIEVEVNREDERVKVPVDTGHRWQSFIVRTPPDCIVGRWMVSIDTVDKAPTSRRQRTLHRFTYKYSLYILFNAWNRADQVFMENANLRDEYVLNEFGKIVTGNYKQVTAKPWLFGQFDSFILDCCLHLLDTAGCAHQVRKDAAEICRALANVITSSDNKTGLLLNAWTGQYGETGVPPTSWTGSTSILEQYWRTRNPVKYGHCYVFAGIATTICRALGIPCRPVTTFGSAHDCDRLMTIDTHWCIKGNPIRQLNEDAIWSFHVWNEAWMKRPDLFENYAGWQAFDTTPQITSHGTAFAGPSPVKAIKSGNVNIPFNTELFFTEINADIINWFFEEDGYWKSRIVKYRTGKVLYTKKARPSNRRFLAIRTMKISDTKDLDDITTHYKFQEGSEEDRSAIYRADVAACHAGLVDLGKPDVKFEIKHLDDIVIGNVFDIIVKVQNQNRKWRTINLTLELFTAYYTGVQKSRIKYETFHFELDAIKTEEAVVHVVAEEYLHRMADHSCFKINVLGTVLETGQVFCEQEDFRLCKPELEIDIPRKVILGNSFDCKIHFMNPTPINLMRCEWILEATGIQRSIKLIQPNMEPYEIADLSVTLTARKLGTQYVVVTFNSHEVMDVNGVMSINVMLTEEFEAEMHSKTPRKQGPTKLNLKDKIGRKNMSGNQKASQVEDTASYGESKGSHEDRDLKNEVECATVK